MNTDIRLFLENNPVKTALVLLYPMKKKPMKKKPGSFLLFSSHGHEQEKNNAKLLLAKRHFTSVPSYLVFSFS
jgi:hypothetical protein